MIESSDLYMKLIKGARIWLEMHENHPKECDVCTDLLKVLIAVVHISGSKLSYLIIELCGYGLNRIVCSMMSGRQPSKDVLDLMKSSSFILLRVTVEEELNSQKNVFKYDITQRVKSLSYLISGMETIQRLGLCFGAKSVRINGRPGPPPNGSKAGAGVGLLEFGSPVRPKSGYGGSAFNSPVKLKNDRTVRTEGEIDPSISPLAPSPRPSDPGPGLLTPPRSGRCLVPGSIGPSTPSGITLEPLITDNEADILAPKILSIQVFSVTLKLLAIIFISIFYGLFVFHVFNLAHFLIENSHNSFISSYRLIL